MPLRKDVTKLQDLCIENMARNIVIHGEILKKFKDSEIYHIYKHFQYLFTNDLRMKLISIFTKEEAHPDKNFKKFRDLVLQGGIVDNLDSWPCFEFIFNEFTTMFPLLMKKADRLPRELLHIIPSQCENLRYVALGILDSHEVLERILHECLFITVLSADLIQCRGTNSDAFLLCLCKHRSASKKFIFCPEKGDCCQSGKHLRSLRVVVKNSPGHGIACALQHLPQLRDFMKLPLWASGDRAIRICSLDVVCGVMMLQNAAVANGSSLIILQLTDLFFQLNINDDELSMVSVCCPKLKSVQLNLRTDGFNPQVFTMLNSLQNLRRLHLLFLANANRIFNSTAFKYFLRTQCAANLKTVSVIDTWQTFFLNTTHFDRILEMCYNLEEFNFRNIELSNLSDGNILPNMKKLLFHLEEPSRFFNLQYPLPTAFTSFFSDLLCRARNVRSLDITQHFAENELARAMELGDFRNLEYLCIRNTDMNKVSLQTLVNASNNLTKIQLRNCQNTDSFIQYCRETAAKCNFALEIEDSPDCYGYEE